MDVHQHVEMTVPEIFPQNFSTKMVACCKSSFSVVYLSKFFLLQFCRADFGWWFLQDWSLTRTGKIESELEWNSYSTRVSVLTRFPFLHSSSWILCLCAQRVVRNLSECSQQCCFDCLQHCCFDKSSRPFLTITRNYGITLRVLPRNVAQTWWGCFPVGTTVLWCAKASPETFKKKKR